MIEQKEVWVIMSKDRKYIAKGTPRNRSLELVEDRRSKKRTLTYASKGVAENAFKNNWFYGRHDLKPEDMEAILCSLTLEAL